MSEEHRKPFNGEIKIKHLEDDDCQFSGIPGLVTVELLQHYHTEARWIGKEADLERGLQEVGRAYKIMHRHWEMRRQALLAEDRAVQAFSLVEPVQSDLGEETDHNEVAL